jgi:hypothetical protein
MSRDLREQADPVSDDEYWTQGLDVAVEGEPLVHRDLRGELNIKISGIPSHDGETITCWVQIVEGDLFTGIGKLIVDSFTEDKLDDEMVEPDDLVYYREGTQQKMPRYAGIYEKALEW